MIAARKGKCPHCGHDHDAENQEFRRLLSETTAPRAAETGEDAELARFLVAGDLSIMFHDGKGRSLSVEEKVTILNALCASSRPAIIEECARVAASAHWHAHEPLPKCVHAIRALAPGGQNAPKDYDMLQDLKAKMAPAPAEVAEGAGEVPDVCIANDPLRTRFDLPRAAPSLSREEWGMLDDILDKVNKGISVHLVGDRWNVLRAKVREAGK